MCCLRRFTGNLRLVVLISLIGTAGYVLVVGRTTRPAMIAASQQALRRPVGRPQLVRSESRASSDGEMCEWMPVNGQVTLASAIQHQGRLNTDPAGQGDEERTSIDADRAPIRIIRDSFPTYSAVAVDLKSNEVYLQDENLFGLKIFNRLDDTPPAARFTEPKRTIGGLETRLEFNCALYVDPKTGDVYSVNNDTVGLMTVFPHDAKGNVAPMRSLKTPHGTFGIAVNEEAQELFLTVQHDNAVVVFRKTAEKDEAPIRLLQGEQTRLADPHGIALDSKNNLLFVTNHGSVHQVIPPKKPRAAGSGKPNWPSGRLDGPVPGSGKFNPPSITVYPLKASGDTPPVHVIEGPKTQLNWPSTLALYPDRGELFVANDTGDSILVFRTTDNGDIPPLRVIKGPKTGLSYPTGLFADTKNGELWAADMGNHSATVYPLTANGDVAPLRTVRSAPLGKAALDIGNPGAAAYDSKRDEILVPN
jgi:DNA-binding beta-propeller fold protein YncE